ncbi:hypothetical protein COCSUDRAFT_57087 [Coccomyxa subellipsoidea C-169]|uniref:Uncharacterized protein n=1 Tax=Coccomyxa subellipsoidea (strain C-169) TaxID=574566 RepID=I0YS04_COCSC|nr:hypothetical protein COCSUDRAFT_57087 [Coccomyxa subellipsoidea C-169]EIE21173.1 hypothetical protein COCSUDRAFT_57087 [Coccomyxa subellipsoidea C-169]|eukprot:XP_005645717.1 hypothetical protein COCSUDRAFT_57087 [Coccomyxa subellipsoidea C-169]
MSAAEEPAALRDTQHEQAAEPPSGRAAPKQAVPEADVVQGSAKRTATGLVEQGTEADSPTCHRLEANDLARDALGRAPLGQAAPADLTSAPKAPGGAGEGPSAPNTGQQPVLGLRHGPTSPLRQPSRPPSTPKQRAATVAALRAASSSGVPAAKAASSEAAPAAAAARSLSVPVEMQQAQPRLDRRRRQQRQKQGARVEQRQLLLMISDELLKRERMRWMRVRVRAARRAFRPSAAARDAQKLVAAAARPLQDGAGTRGAQSEATDMDESASEPQDGEIQESIMMSEQASIKRADPEPCSPASAAVTAADSICQKTPDCCRAAYGCVSAEFVDEDGLHVKIAVWRGRDVAAAGMPSDKEGQAACAGQEGSQKAKAADGGVEAHSGGERPAQAPPAAGGGACPAATAVDGGGCPGDSCPLQMLLHALHLLEQHSPWQLARQMGRMQGKGGTLAALLRLQRSWANGFQKGELQQTPPANPAQAQGHRKMPDQNPAGNQQEHLDPTTKNTGASLWGNRKSLKMEVFCHPRQLQQDSDALLLPPELHRQRHEQ